MSAQKERRIAIRAGLFIALGTMLFGLVVLLIGRERRLFDPQTSFHAWFENVDGLKKDSPVWLGGLEVGRVTSITFSPDLGDKRIGVTMEIGARYAERVRSDSMAHLASRGVLGDKAIDISLGTSEGLRISPGGEIKSGPAGDLSSLMKSGGEILENATVITRDVRRAVEAYSDPGLEKNVASSMASIAHLLSAAEKGTGTIHELFYDKHTGEDMKTLIARASDTAARVDAAASEVDKLLNQVRTGEGAAHAVFYDPKGAQAITALGSAAGELQGLLRDAKNSKNGAVHQLVYGDASGMFADLGAASADLKRITGSIAAGHGTVGALIQDPTVYDDLRTILGNIKRNRILRALVRFSLSNGEDTSQMGKLEKDAAPRQKQ